ncbi:helix-turn-helix domain-containing protein [Desulfovibrio sp. ZJ200]|uniref:helix-turn-helix domain-containing protein n=1 Tax=Desulfovibrio sp. ZJ200 TaxID=2709792 RepID=UPI0013EAD09B|nr:helix-turn-helix domain-containing protein [Desulfovibrio sp. ZJ200]
METLNPSAYFLRVSDKFFGEFICFDKAVSDGPTLLYLTLFRKAYKGGVCRSSQATLARLCKCSVRSIQHYLRALAALEYISIEQQEDGRNVYRLLLSQRVLFFIAQERAAMDDNDDGNEKGEEFSSCHAKNRRMGGENSSPIYKSNKSIIPPLSPHSSARREPSPSARAPLPSTTPVTASKAGGWGDSFPRKKQKGNTSAFQTANALFERLYAAYPRKEAKESARAVWHQLWRRGALPALDILLAALDRFRSSTAWNREHGRFVPHLANWLRGRRWEDEAAVPLASSSGVPVAPSASPEKAEQIRRCLERLGDRHSADPSLAEARPVFEKFLSCFADGGKSGPAWGLWSLLFRKGKAPSAGDVKGRGMMDAFVFLQNWQRGVHASA